MLVVEYRGIAIGLVDQAPVVIGQREGSPGYERGEALTASQSSVDARREVVNGQGVSRSGGVWGGGERVWH